MVSHMKTLKGYFTLGQLFLDQLKGFKTRWKQAYSDRFMQEMNEPFWDHCGG